MDDEGHYDLLLQMQKMAMLSVAVGTMYVHQCALDSERALLLKRMHNGDDENESDGSRTRAKRTRRVFIRPDYSSSMWANMLRDGTLKDSSSRAAILFRKRFRIPYPCFLGLVSLVRNKGWFRQGRTDAAGRPSIPVELKVLAALQILGRGTFYDDICQMSLMSEATVCTVLHTFTERFAQELFNTHIRLPRGAAQDKAMDEYHTVGCSGALGSTDVTHLKWENCPFSEMILYTGKEGYASIAYEATVDYTGRILV